MSNFAKIKSNITRITTNAVKLNGLIHETAMLIMKHAKEHGDCSQAQDLVMAMPASMRRTMLIQWFSLYSPIVTKNDATFKSKLRLSDNNLFVDFNLEGAEATPFWQIANETPESKPMTYDEAVAFVARLAKRFDKELKENHVKAGDKTKTEKLAKALASLVPAK